MKPYPNEYLQPVSDLLQQYVANGQPLLYAWVGVSCLTGILENA